MAFTHQARMIALSAMWTPTESQSCAHAAAVAAARGERGRQRQRRLVRQRQPWGLLALALATLLLAVLATTARAFVVPSGGRLPVGQWQQQQHGQSILTLSSSRVHGRPLRMVLDSLRPPTPKTSRPQPPDANDNNRAAEKEATIVLVAGFEAFNVQLYRQAAAKLADACPALRLVVFTERDVAERPVAVAAELARADIFFGSLIFDYDQVNWLTERIEHIPARFIFESALELMSKTQVGDFSMAPPSGGQQAAGPPPVVKALLSKFFGAKEEDRLKVTRLSTYLCVKGSGRAMVHFEPNEAHRLTTTSIPTFTHRRTSLS